MQWSKAYKKSDPVDKASEGTNIWKSFAGVSLELKLTIDESEGDPSATPIKIHILIPRIRTFATYSEAVCEFCDAPDKVSLPITLVITGCWE